MQVPEHWAEARLVGKVKGLDRVVRRWGWSDISAADAQRHAQQRAAAALAERQAGRPVPTRERKQPYGGAGLPIREEVVARNGADVITRNSYGARCLNVPDVLFADVDFVPHLSALQERAFSILAWAVGLSAIVVAVVMFSSLRQGLGCASVALSFFGPIVVLVVRVRQRHKPGSLALARARQLAAVHAFALSDARARLAIYETPLGLRVLALHATFDPNGPATRELFAAIGTDRAYAQMCELQACFRARVSAKPWRIHVPNIVTRSVWPVPAERRAEREQWIARYEEKARGFAACRFVEAIGGGSVDARCAEVQRVHDELCRARSDLPIA